MSKTGKSKSVRRETAGFEIEIFLHPFVIGRQHPFGVHGGLLLGRLLFRFRPLKTTVQEVEMIDPHQRLDGEDRGDVLVMDRQQVVTVAFESEGLGGRESQSL